MRKSHKVGSFRDCEKINPRQQENSRNHAKNSVIFLKMQIPPEKKKPQKNMVK
jgi:hypothetical protein